MRGIHRAQARHGRRLCLTCGYRGGRIQRHLRLVGYRCPKCGQDLYARPPRSYAEMEGFAHDIPTRVRTGVARAGASCGGLVGVLIRTVAALGFRVRPPAAGAAPQIHDDALTRSDSGRVRGVS